MKIVALTPLRVCWNVWTWTGACPCPQ